MTKRYGRSLVVLVVLGVCLVFTVPQESVSAASSGQVTRMGLAARPANYTGTCPVTIHFAGNITMNGPGTMSYGVDRSDGAKGNGGSHTFERAGAWASPELTSWTLGAPGQNYNGWVMIGSGNVRSNKAMFHVHCRK